MSDGLRSTQVEALEYALGALRSNQDVLLHKVARTQIVREQLEVNRTAILRLKDAMRETGRDVQ